MRLQSTLLAMAALAMAPVAHAAVVALNFTGVATPTANQTTVGGFYDGGVSGDGTSGTNYGVAFSSNALAVNTYNGCCSPDPGILFFLSGGAVTIDYAAGFTTGFSFYYSSTVAAPIQVFSGLDGTGTLLATINVSAQFDSNCTANNYCNWTPIGVTFAGVAESINFGGTANHTAYDDVTFGAASPTVPEPAAWALMLVGLGGVGGAMRARRTRIAAAV